MQNKIDLEIRTPTRSFYNNAVDFVVMRTIDGDIGVLHGHIPLVTVLDYGIMSIQCDTEDIKIAIMTGLLEITPQKVTVLADDAHYADEIDIDRAIAAKKRAEQILIQKREDMDIHRAQAALHRALLRIKLTGR